MIIRLQILYKSNNKMIYKKNCFYFLDFKIVLSSVFLRHSHNFSFKCLLNVNTIHLVAFMSDSLPH